jgi:hypothetical protein
MAPDRDTTMRALARVALFLSFAVAAPCASLAQTAQPAPAQSMDLSQLTAAMTRYYQRPSDIVTILTSWEKLGGPGADNMMGFLAGCFATKPDQIGRVTKAPLGQKAQLVVVKGLRLADRTNDAKAAASHWNWPASEVAKLNPAILVTKGAQTFDVMWGASFATGDATYVRPIYDYLAAFLSEPGVNAADVMTMVAVKLRIANPEAVKEMAGRYPKETFIQVAHAASALWSLESNARQHKFVAAALEQYAKKQPQSPAIKAIDDVKKLRSR